MVFFVVRFERRSRLLSISHLVRGPPLFRGRFEDAHVLNFGLRFCGLRMLLLARCVLNFGTVLRQGSEHMLGRQ